MYKEVSLNEGVDIFAEIKKQVKNINKTNDTNIEFNFDQHYKIMDICNMCVEEIKSNNHKVDDFVKIASLCNALSIFPVSKNKHINTEIIVSVLLEMTSKVGYEIEIKQCSDKLKQKIIEKIVKIQQNPKVSPYLLGKYLRILRSQNQKAIQQPVKQI